jgi:hypothetical protein
MQKTIITLLIILLAGAGIYYFVTSGSSENIDVPENSTPSESTNTENNTEAEPVSEERKEQTIIGQSVNGRDIVAYHYGQGETEVLFVGGIHGGYEWNTTLVARAAMDHFKANPTAVPENVTVTIIPSLNPDGLYKVVNASFDAFTASDVTASQTLQESGRFNANDVDLNRNFDCDWQANATWQSRSVSGGTAAFSEPESKAIRDYIESNAPEAVVVWYSAAGGVFASSCHNGVLPKTTTLTNLYANASGYPAFEDFNFYEITGDMVNWLAKENIPAISVLLTNHSDIEWTKNKAGIEAILSHYAN